MKKLFLLDSFALAFRIYYAFSQNPLFNAKGEPTSVLYGYLGHLFRLLQEEKPDYFAVVLDTAKPTFRHELYPEYKANRSEMPEDMRLQLPELNRFLQESGLPVWSMAGYEADDLMASLALQAKAKGVQTYMVTRDKDMTQLVDESIFLFNLEKSGVPNTIVDAQGVLAKYGVKPEQMGDYLALVGDASDNIPGVPKIGPKTAMELLKKYGTLKGIYLHLEDMGKKAARITLEANRAKAEISRQLVTLRCDLCEEVDFADLELKNIDFDYIESFLEEKELRMLKRSLNEWRKTTQNISEPEVLPVIEKSFEYLMVQTSKEEEQFWQALSTHTQWVLDTETRSLDLWENELVGLCFACEANFGYYIPLAHTKGNNLDRTAFLKRLQEYLNQASRTWIFHNAKFDLHVLHLHGVQVQGCIHDTMLASYLLAPGVREHSLDFQVAKRLGHKMIPIDSLIGSGKKQISFAEVEAQVAAPYGAEDAVYTFRLWEVLKPELEQKDLYRVYETLELPLLQVLAHMERNGICVDSAFLREQGKELAVQIQQLQDQIYARCGQVFNIASPKQLGEVLFGALKLPVGKKTKTGYSTDSSVLEELREYHPVVDDILIFRELEKLKNTYVDVLPDLVSVKTHRLHTSFNQVITATGRLSSNNPNLQNIPIRTEQGRRIRKAFCTPHNDLILLCADYSQIELRVLAHLSGDEGLMSAFREGVDIHSRTASLLHGIDISEVNSEMRRQAKAINFGVLYGMSAFRLARETGISRYQATQFIEQYFAGFPGVKGFLESTVQQARNTGYVETIGGRKRFLPDLLSDNGNIRNGAERMAINTPIQGSAADLIKQAMILMHTQISNHPELELKMLLQVHDELVFEVPKAKGEEARKLVIHTMEHAMELSVPLKVEAGMGQTWLDAH
jgi:DNA polymerase I